MDVKQSNKQNQRKFGRYMGDVGSYLDKVRNGRSVRSVDPGQPALGPEAELIRQTDKIDRANSYDKLMNGKRYVD